MSPQISLGEVRVGPATQAAARGESSPFHIAVLGGFSGRGDGSLKPLEIDRDNFEEVFAQLNVQWPDAPVGEDGKPAAVRFAELDDFHPDALYQKLPLFQQLARLKRQLASSGGFDQAAAAIRGWAQRAGMAAPQEPKAISSKNDAPPAGIAMPDDLLSAAFEATTGPAPPGAPSAFEQAIARIVAPYAQKGADPRREELAACVDQIAAEMMRRVLHDSRFQALESAWRGLYLLVRRLDTDAKLKVFLIDVSKEALAADLLPLDDLTKSQTFKRVIEQPPGGKPWAVLAGIFTFGAEETDARLLHRIGALGQAAQAPWLAAAANELTGCLNPNLTPDPDDWAAPKTSDAWAALRATPQADWLGLLWPRFLLRLPYGAKTSPLEQFRFEELPPDADSHERLLWGNPALAAACLLGKAYSDAGWKLRPGAIDELGSLPLWTSQDEDGDTVAHPCGELLLTSRGAERVASQGITPLLSVRGQDVVQLPAIRSLAGKPLLGRWTGE